jgi:hypothetical protein
MVGLTGYVIVSILYVPITGRGGIIEMAIATELFQKTQNHQIEELKQK